MQDCKDGSGLQFINFDLVTGGQEIKVSIGVEFSFFFSRYCVSSVNISFLLLLLVMVSSYFKIIKQD